MHTTDYFIRRTHAHISYSMHIIIRNTRTRRLLPSLRQASAQSWGLKGELAPDSDPNLTPDYGFGIQVEVDGGTALVGSFQSGNITISDPP